MFKVVLALMPCTSKISYICRHYKNKLLYNAGGYVSVDATVDICSHNFYEVLNTMEYIPLKRIGNRVKN